MDIMNNFYTPIRCRIFTLLESKAIPQKKFAEAIGVNAVTVTRWKTGQSFSFVKQLDIIAEALGTSEAFLLHGGEGGPPPRRKKESPPGAPAAPEPLTPDEQQLLHDYRTLNAQGQEYIRQTMHMAVQTYKKSSDLSKLEG